MIEDPHTPPFHQALIDVASLLPILLRPSVTASRQMSMITDTISPVRMTGTATFSYFGVAFVLLCFVGTDGNISDLGAVVFFGAVSGVVTVFGAGVGTVFGAGVGTVFGAGVGTVFGAGVGTVFVIFSLFIFLRKSIESLSSSFVERTKIGVFTLAVLGKGVCLVLVVVVVGVVVVVVVVVVETVSGVGIGSMVVGTWSEVGPGSMVVWTVSEVWTGSSVGAP